MKWYIVTALYKGSLENVHRDPAFVKQTTERNQRTIINLMSASSFRNAANDMLLLLLEWWWWWCEARGMTGNIQTEGEGGGGSLYRKG